MSKVATNRANLVYAKALRKQGYKTAVHALPGDGKEFVDELLAKNFTLRQIANEVMKKYGKEMEKRGMKPISHMSIQRYKEKFFDKTPAFRKMVIHGSEATKEEAEKVLKEFDAYKEMVSLAKDFKRNRLMKVKKMEKKIQLPTDRGDRVYQQYFDMCQAILTEEMELGMRVRPSLSIDMNESVDIDLEDKTLIKQAEKALAVLKGDKNDKRKSLGEKVGSISGKT